MASSPFALLLSMTGASEMSKPRTFGVIGLGTFGSTVATELAGFDNHVIGIDAKDAPVAAMADTLRDAVIADGRDEKALREAGIGQCDVVLVSIGDDLEASIVCAMNVKLIGIENIWAKADTRTHHRILSRLGVDRVIHPEEQMGQRVAQMLHNPTVRDYVSLGNGFFAVTMMVPDALEGKALSSLEMGSRFDVKCLEIMRGRDLLTNSDADPVLKKDDRMLVLGTRPDLREFAKSF